MYLNEILGGSVQISIPHNNGLNCDEMKNENSISGNYENYKRK